MPKLSIIVPTRERSDTLVHAIRTLVSQDYADCEIIVSDNASQDDTREVVASFSDPRIRYINTGRRMSMSENWEFALADARGEFITYVGDDDGFVRGAVAKAMRLVDESGVSALAWTKVDYYWPECPIENLRNFIFLKGGNNQVHMANGLRKLKGVLDFREAYGYSRLPCIYNGVIRRSLLEEAKASSINGKFFNSQAPDVFSAIVLSMMTNRYLLSEYPFSVSGNSRHSIGHSYFGARTNGANSPGARWLAENCQEYDPRVKMAGCVATTVMGEYLLARKFFPGIRFPEPPWKAYVQALIRHARTSVFADDILQSAAHTAKLLGVKIKIPERVECRVSAPVIGIQGDLFRFKAPAGIVSNVYDACQLIEGMVPDPSKGDRRTSLARFVTNMNGVFISEAKSLYRSL
jgi:glycosyltransferase involved in cell wall biosynthesis